MKRDELEAHWLRLTRQDLPAAAKARDWPVRLDHCFQRILLDNAAGRVWYEVITGRPAYRHASDSLLKKAVQLGEAALDGRVDLSDLNKQSLSMRGKDRS
jgi:hypothetical protein